MRQPSRIEQLGTLMTAVMAVMISGQSDLLLGKHQSLVRHINPREFLNGGKYKGIYGRIAKDLGVTRVFVNRVVHGHSSSSRVSAAFLAEIKRVDAISTPASLTSSERDQFLNGKYAGASPRIAASLGVSNATVNRVIRGKIRSSNGLVAKILPAIRTEMRRVDSLPSEVPSPPLTLSEQERLRRGEYFGIYKRIAVDLGCGVDKVAYHAKNATPRHDIRRAVRAEITRIGSLPDVLPLTDAEKQQFGHGGIYRGILRRISLNHKIQASTVRQVAAGVNTNQRILRMIRAEMTCIDAEPKNIPPTPLSAIELSLFSYGGKYYGLFSATARSLGATKSLICSAAHGRERSARALSALRAAMARVDAELAAKNGGR